MAKIIRNYIYERSKEKDSLNTVILKRKFLVGEFRKSTRHLQIPSSVTLMFSMTRTAGSVTVLKWALVPNKREDDQCRAELNGFPRTSKLSVIEEETQKRISQSQDLRLSFIFITSAAFMTHVRNNGRWEVKVNGESNMEFPCLTDVSTFTIHKEADFLRQLSFSLFFQEADKQEK